MQELSLEEAMAQLELLYQRGATADHKGSTGGERKVLMALVPPPEGQHMTTTSKDLSPPPPPPPLQHQYPVEREQLHPVRRKVMPMSPNPNVVAHRGSSPETSATTTQDSYQPHYQHRISPRGEDLDRYWNEAAPGYHPSSTRTAVHHHGSSSTDNRLLYETSPRRHQDIAYHPSNEHRSISSPRSPVDQSRTRRQRSRGRSKSPTFVNPQSWKLSGHIQRNAFGTYTSPRNNEEQEGQEGMSEQWNQQQAGLYYPRESSPGSASSPASKFMHLVGETKSSSSPHAKNGSKKREHPPPAGYVPVYRYNPQDLTLVGPEKYSVPPQVSSVGISPPRPSVPAAQQEVSSRAQLTSPVPRESMVSHTLPKERNVYSGPQPAVWSFDKAQQGHTTYYDDTNRQLSPPRSVQRPESPRRGATPRPSPSPTINRKKRTSTPQNSGHKKPRMVISTAPNQRILDESSPSKKVSACCQSCGHKLTQNTKYKHVKSTISRIPNVVDTHPELSPRRRKANPFFMSSAQPGQIMMSPPTEKPRNTKGIAWVV